MPITPRPRSICPSLHPRTRSSSGIVSTFSRAAWTSHTTYCIPWAECQCISGPEVTTFCQARPAVNFSVSTWRESLQCCNRIKSNSFGKDVTAFNIQLSTHCPRVSALLSPLLGPSDVEQAQQRWGLVDDFVPQLMMDVTFSGDLFFLDMLPSSAFMDASDAHARRPGNASVSSRCETSSSKTTRPLNNTSVVRLTKNTAAHSPPSKKKKTEKCEIPSQRKSTWCCT